MVLDLNDVVRNLNDMMARLIGEDIAIINRLDPDLGRVKGDASQIEQVLLNLAVNARDAMARGGTLTIETSNIDIDHMAQRYSGAKPGEYVLLTVRDTGTGMDEDTMTANLRAILHHQGKREGHRPRPGDCLRHHQAERRLYFSE